MEARRTIEAPVDVVFAILCEPRTYPLWLVGAQQIRAVDSTFPAPGSAFQHSVGPAEDVTVHDSTEVVAAEPPHRLVLRVHVGRMDGTVELLVRPGPGGSEVRFREEPAGWPRCALPLLRPLLHGRNVESLRRLEHVINPHGT